MAHVKLALGASEVLHPWSMNHEGSSLCVVELIIVCSRPQQSNCAGIYQAKCLATILYHKGMRGVFWHAAQPWTEHIIHVPLLCCPTGKDDSRRQSCAARALTFNHLICLCAYTERSHSSCTERTTDTCSNIQLTSLTRTATARYARHTQLKLNPTL